TVALVVLFDLGFEPFATQVKHFWEWTPSRAGLFWHSAPWVNFVGWAATALVILAFATPSLINKKPVKHPSDYHPLFIWVLLNVLFITGALNHHLWAAATAIGMGVVIVVTFAIKGATW